MILVVVHNIFFPGGGDIDPNYLNEKTRQWEEKRCKMEIKSKGNYKKE
jgi:hypothetical protein